MELWDLYNESGESLGIDHIRGEEIPDNCYHLVVHVWIKNSNNQFLLSKRSENRPTFPLMWETVGGSVLKGETSIEGALREVKEEIGIDLTEDNGKLIFRKVRQIINGKKFNDILDVWMFNYNGNAILDNATTDEVCETKWLTMKEIKVLYDNDALVNTLSYIFDIVK